MSTPLTLILAATKSNGIGAQGRLPWHLPNELKYFAKSTTSAPPGTHNAVLMGRNTWESIPKRWRPLKGRVNVVLSRDKGYDLGTDDQGVLLKDSIQSALDALDTKSTHRVFVIGGAKLYKEALSLALPSSSSSTTPTPYVTRILLTRILEPSFECDVSMGDFLGLESSHPLESTESTESGDSGDEVRWRWTRAPHAVLKEWVGFDVRGGVQEEGGVKYEFQMWVRGGGDGEVNGVGGL